jgi:hypothetical protein
MNGLKDAEEMLSNINNYLSKQADS